MKIEMRCISGAGEVTDLSDVVSNISVKGASKECTRTLDFKALRADVDKSYSQYNVNLGDTIIVAEVFEDGSSVEFFRGIVWTKDVRDNDISISITCYDKSIYLNKNEPETQVFSNQTPDAVANKIISELGLSAGDLPSGRADNYNLRNMTGYDAILAVYTKLSAINGKEYKLYCDGDKISVLESGKMHNIVLEELDEPLVGKLLNTSYTESLDELVNEIKVIEDEQKDKKEEVQTNTKSQERYGAIQKVIKGNPSEAQGLMKDAKRELDIECIGDWDMVTGKSIEVNSSIINGVFYIVSDEHSLDDAVHTVRLKLSSDFEMDTKGEASGES